MWDGAQVAFCDALKALLTGLLAYVQANHKTGLEWNPRGQDASQYTGASSGSGVFQRRASVLALGLCGCDCDCDYVVTIRIIVSSQEYCSSIDVETLVTIQYIRFPY